MRRILLAGIVGAAVAGCATHEKEIVEKPAPSPTVVVTPPPPQKVEVVTPQPEPTKVIVVPSH
jgi:hypothetical protein